MPSYEKNESSKLWSVRFREKDTDGKVHNQRLSGFKTRKAAQEAYEKRIAENDQKKIKSGDEILFDTLYAKFIEYKKTRIKITTYQNIEIKFRHRIIPFFTGKKMADILPSDIIDFESELQKEYKYNSVKHYLTLLASFYLFGYRYYGITDTMKLVERSKPKINKREMSIWTLEELGKVLPFFGENRHIAMMVKVMYFVGLRKGEALALTYDDLDFANDTISISKSVSKVIGQDSIISTPKTQASIRTVNVPHELMQELSDYRMWQMRTAPGQYLFYGEKPMSVSNINQHMDRVSKLAGVKKIRVHDLRHSCASYLLSNGVSIVAVSKQLGHGNTQETLNTYAHMMPSDVDVVKMAQNNAFSKLKSCT